MKAITGTPPIHPVTHKHPARNINYDKYWIINNYRPQLEIMQEIDLQKLIFERVVGGAYLG